ncbi:PEP-CTERM sorting domain-containing protein [Candidatus Omnitrophota bacterium]
MKDLLRKLCFSLTLLGLPFIYGCIPPVAGGSSGLTSFLFGSGSLPIGSGVSEIALSSVTAADVAMITNPEPASMLLVGGGMVAMACLKARKNRLK